MRSKHALFLFFLSVAFLCTAMITSKICAMYNDEKEITIFHTSIKPQNPITQAFSKEEIDSFLTQGYVVVKEFFNKEEIDEISKCADRLEEEAKTLSKSQTGKIIHKGTQFVIDKIEGEGNKIKIHRLVWVGAAEPDLLRLGRAKKITHRIAQLLGNDVADHLINQLHYKLPRDEVRFSWHQDIKNRRLFDPDWQDVNGKGSFVQVITAIDPMTTENGPINIIPGLPLEGDLYLDKIQDPKELEKKIDISRSFPLLLNPGDTIFMHPYLLHGSEPNISSDKRRVFINGFSYPGANKKPYPGEGSAQQISLCA